MMTLSPQLIGYLIQIAAAVPALEAEVNAVFQEHSVTPEQEAAGRAILAEDPNSYFVNNQSAANKPGQA